jgi:iron-sulfur cluster assembly protein
VTVTPSAASRLQQIFASSAPGSVGIKLGVRTRGCNGLSYQMSYADKVEKTDECVDVSGVKLYIESKALLYLIGTTVDYIDNEIVSEFTFSNPNSKGSCGCGESFTV